MFNAYTHNSGSFVLFVVSVSVMYLTKDIIANIIMLHFYVVMLLSTKRYNYF